MKKLNRKGFTLVELLAVIIILAVVVGLTIPAILTTTTKTKEKAFQTAADTTANWIDRQYTIATAGLDYTGVATLDSNFKAVCGANGASCAVANGKTLNDTDPTHVAFMVAAGLNKKNVSTVKVEINSSTGRTCVTLTAKSNGDYYNVVEGNTMKSSNCK